MPIPTDRDAVRTDAAALFLQSRGMPFVQIDDRLSTFCAKQLIDAQGIVRCVKQHLLCLEIRHEGPGGEPGMDETVGIVAGRRSQIRKDGQVMF